MSISSYESTLNTWLAEALSARGLAAKPESGQGGGKRLDVELQLGGVKIALEAEQGSSANKRAAALKDADSRLRDELADCAIAICYPEGLQSRQQLAQCQLLHSLRSHKERPPAAKTQWQRSDIGQLANVIRKIPEQLGDPDEIANRLSFSLDRAVDRLSERQKQELAAALDLPAGKAQKSPFLPGLSSRYNQAAKRSLLVIATAVMFHAQLDNHRHHIRPRHDNRLDARPPYTGAWPPARAADCAEDADPIGAFYAAWDLWLAVDYKPIFATAREALQGCAQDNNFSQAVRGTARAALKVTRNIVGLRHDLLGRIFHKVLDSARYDGSFYTTTAAATLLANLAIRQGDCDWHDASAIARLRITDPACGTGTLLMAAAERIRDLARDGQIDSAVSKLLIEKVLTGYDVNLTATHLAATTLGLLSPTTTFSEMKIYRALLGVDENREAKLGSLEFLNPEKEKQPRLMPWPASIAQVDSQQIAARAEAADLLIMNPPFTRDSLRHDQFSKADERKLKAREKELFAGQPVHLSSNGNAFLVLADHIAKFGGGTIAAIVPLVTATNASALGIRKFLAQQFHIDTIVTSHDPTRIYFSENTSIGEMLLICRRQDFTPTLNPSPIKREGLSSPFEETPVKPESHQYQKTDAVEKWTISPELERRMQAVARELRKNPTAAEAKLWQAIRKRQLQGRKFRRQVAIGAFVVDFYCSSERLAVEVDGPVHEVQVEADQIRQELIESLGIRFVRVTNDEVEYRLHDAIHRICGAFSSNPPAPHQEGGTSVAMSEPAEGDESPASFYGDGAQSIRKPAAGDESPLPHFGGGGLGVGEKPPQTRPTTIVNLYENPATPATALIVARDIADGNTERIKGTVQRWSRSRIKAGDWGGVQFLSPYLCERFYELRRGDFFETLKLGDLAEVGPAGRRTQDAFVRSELPDKDAKIALWYHKSKITQSMLAKWDTYIIPIAKKRNLAEKYWTQRSTFMLTNRMRLNTMRLTCVRLDNKVLGSLWVPCRFTESAIEQVTLEKATCAYMNSTIGILALLGDRSNKIPSYPQFSLDDLRRIPMPDFNALAPAQVSALAAGYDALCEFTLLPLPLILKDETRLALDRIVTRALGIDAALAAALRRELAREPSITGKPYEV